MASLRLNRRQTLAGLGSLFAAPALIGPAQAEGVASPLDPGLVAGSSEDQSAALQAAIDAAADAGRDLLLPAGSFHAQNLILRGAMRVIGAARSTRLLSAGDGPVAFAREIDDLVLDGIAFGPGGGSPSGESGAYLILDRAQRIAIRDCGFTGPSTGIGASASSATIENCVFTDLGDAAIHSSNSTGGMFVRGNRISGCGNAGIRIWRDAAGHDGSIVTGNSIGRIDWKGGGNGQNGNGVNVFQADGVIVADNVIGDCAFTAVRINAGRNCHVRGNLCTNSGEVAIFSEFGFSGSIIADNIIDGAATGIDITNFDTGGYLATCTGNIVRNIFPRSAVNPDTRPVGIYAEADTIVSGNVIENVPGIGIAAGYGPFLRNVSISDNVLTGCTIGIGVTVVNDPRIGHVRISNNLIGPGAQHGIVGLEWENTVSDDLVRDAPTYPHVSLNDNTVG